MNLRTQEEFIDEVARELSWRRVELTELKNIVETAVDGSNRQKTAMKSAVALLYGHWEGFVKKTAEAYLNYVERQRLANDKLSNCMFALVLRSKLTAASASTKIAAHIELVDFMRNKTGARSRISPKNAIRTEANLSSTVLEEILKVLDIRSASYEPKYKLLDKSLLDKRNHIAHGEDSELELDEYLELHHQVIALIEMFRSDVENSAILRRFELT
jgi:hypothetical protein